MNVDVKFINLFNKLSLDQKGVFTLLDLKMIISPNSKVDLYRQIKKLVDQKLILNACRGIYIARDFSIEALVLTMRPDALFSLEYALAFHNMIGTYAENKVRPIITVSTKSIRHDKFTIDFKKMKPSLMFGFDVVDGIRIASKEKALLDTLYFYQSGTKFYFDIYSDIDLDRIDRNLIKEYLKEYKNPKFIRFVEDYLND